MHKGVADPDSFLLLPTSDGCFQLTIANWRQTRRTISNVKPETYHHCESEIILHLFHSCPMVQHHLQLWSNTLEQISLPVLVDNHAGCEGRIGDTFTDAFDKRRPRRVDLIVSADDVRVAVVALGGGDDNLVDDFFEELRRELPVFFMLPLRDHRRSILN